MKLWLIALCLLLGMVSAEARGPRHHPIPIGPSGGGGGAVTFTALHTYFLAPNGNDACNGTSPNIGTSGACAWRTINHPVVCGDVIIAVAGAYTTQFTGQSGTVSTCPSTSGGIDGSGGIYFAALLCGGIDLESCTVTNPNGTNSSTFNFTTSNWTTQGFKCVAPGDRCFMANAPNPTTVVHHLAFINTVASNTTQGFGINDCPGGACNHNIPGSGADYLFIVGVMAQNAAKDAICLAAIDIVGPSNSDLNPGTHWYISDAFSFNHPTSCTSDVEAFMFDTFDAHNARGTAVLRNSMGWLSARYGMQMFYQEFNVGSSATIWKVYNNTFYHNNIGGTVNTAMGEINLQSTAGSSFPYVSSILNNIGVSDFAHGTAGVTSTNYGLVVGGSYATATIGGGSSNNIFKGVAGTCVGSSCDAGNNVVAFNGGSFGTNTYVDPAFTNTTDLLNNRSGVPNCTGFQNVTQCAGWNASTSALTTPSIISDLTPTTSGTTSKGYQRPPVTCGANADFPAALKGVVYLHYAGAGLIQQMPGLSLVPCGF